MPSPSAPPITELLHRVASGESGDVNRLATAVLDRLRAIAHREMDARHSGPLDALTIEPAVLANDALMKLLDVSPDFENRRHFFAYATTIMVRALVDHQRERQAQKRGGDRLRVSLSRLGRDGQDPTVEIETLPPILEELAQLDPRKAEVVQLRAFWGMTISEIAEILELSPSSVDRDWRFARRWLATRLSPENGQQESPTTTTP